MKRHAIIIVSFLLFAGCSMKSAPEPIWIGHLAPLSGPKQAQGEAAVGAMEIVLEKAREADWRVADRSVGVRHVDSAGGRARAEAVRLLAVNRVPGLILGPGMEDAEEVAAVARTHEAVVVVLDEVAEVPFGPEIVLLGPDPARRGRALAHLAEKILKKKRVAVLVDQRDRISAAVAAAFAAAWRQRGEVRQWQIGNAAEQPSTQELAKYKPEVVLIAAGTPRLTNLARSLAGIPILYGGPDTDEEALIGAASQLPAGSELYTATAYSSTAPLSAENKDWRQRYEKSQLQAPSRSAVLAADGLRLMMLVLERAKSAVPKLLREELPRITEFDSAAGKVTWSSGQAVRPLFLVRFEAGKPRLLEKVSGDEP